VGLLLMHNSEGVQAMLEHGRPRGGLLPPPPWPDKIETFKSIKQTLGL